MPLDVRERAALQAATAIANAVRAGDADPSRVATALVTFAVIVCGEDQAARMALALEMMSSADELMGLRCVELDETAFSNGHAVLSGSR
jgi:hypothetical protein